MKRKFWSKAMALLMTICMVISKAMALLMTICMVISMSPLTAFAAEPEESTNIEVQADAENEAVPQEDEPQNADSEYDDNGFAEDGGYQPAVLAEDGFYEISNAGQLYWFAQLVNGYYNSSSDYAVGQNQSNARLTNDVTVNEEISESARKWKPISNETLRYMGTFDGNGHSISGLYFPGTTTYADEDANHYSAAFVVYEKDGDIRFDGSKNDHYGDVSVGLFGFVGENGVVKNVTVKDSVFENGYMDIGAIAGTNDGTVKNCTSEDNTVLGNHSVGGVAGSNHFEADTALLKDCENSSHVTALVAGGGVVGSNYTNGVIEDCTNSGEIDGAADIGGIVGAASNKIADCTNTGDVTSTGDRAAGIAANVGDVEIKNCKNYGNILSRSDYAGGIAASTANTSTIMNCENHGSVTADSTAAENCGYFVGGIVGAATKNTTVKNCINAGSVSAVGSVAGGIAAGLEGTSSVDCSSNSGTVTAKTYSGGIVGRMAYSGAGSIVNNCFNIGHVATSVNGFYAGGIVGQNGRNGYTDRGGSVKNSWNGGEVTVPGSYAAYAGGIYGNLYGAGTVENCYYLDSSAEKGGINGAVTEPDEMTAAQSAEVFASGKIAWYLNNKGGNTETVWYQNVDNDQTHDAYPVLDNESAVVHACGAASEDPAAAYTNMTDADHDTHTMKWSYTALQHWQACERCGAETAKTEHGFGEWTVVRAATASVPGIEQRSCTDCGFAEQRDIYADKSEDKLPETVSGDVTKSVKVENGAPETTMNTSKSDLMDSVLTDSEKAAVTGGANAHIWLEVSALNENEVPAEDKNATDAQVKQLVGENAEIIYLDISLYKQMSGSAQEQLHQSVSPLSITITIPENIRTAADGMRRTFYVLRSHTENGMTICTPISGEYDRASGVFTFETDRFSTYALVYKDTVISSGGHSSSGGSAAATYPVDVKSVTSGTVKADKSTASKDSTVTITVTPDKGYELGKLTVTDKDGKTISVTARGNGQYTFTMPAGSVTVTASFVETDWNLAYRNCPKDSTCPIWPFTDARTTDWYHDGVHFCLENGLMVGYGSNIFRPDAGTTRAMIAVMLWRLNGSPVVNYAMNFDDVKADAWYTEAIRWTASEGVAAGYGNGKFGPDDAMTREQMVTILWRYAQYKGYDVSVGEDTNILSYDDVATVAQYAIPAMQWACGSGMVAGKAQGSGMLLAPRGSTTRAQMATMMMRFCAEIVK